MPLSRRLRSLTPGLSWASFTSLSARWISLSAGERLLSAPITVPDKPGSEWPSSISLASTLSPCSSWPPAPRSCGHAIDVLGLELPVGPVAVSVEFPAEDHLVDVGR